MFLSLQFHTAVFCSVRLRLSFCKLYFTRLPVRFCHAGAAAGHQETREGGPHLAFCLFPDFQHQHWCHLRGSVGGTHLSEV